MVKLEPVSMRWQTLFAFLPILQLYAAYKIEKFRLIFLIVITFGVIRKTIDYMYGTWVPFSFEKTTLESMFFQELSMTHWMLDTTIVVTGVIITVWLIRLWSKQWNEETTHL